MPSLYSHANRNVSSVWYLVLAFLVFGGTTLWKAYAAIQEIDENSKAIAAQLVDVRRDAAQ